MTPERWQQIKTLLESVLELETGQRAAFLDKACFGNPNLREEVDRLISLQEKAEDFLESPPVEAAARIIADQTERKEFEDTSNLFLGNESPRNDPKSLIGSTLDGQYKIEALLGQGGMGTVYRARHILLGDLVAIKVLSAFLSN